MFASRVIRLSISAFLAVLLVVGCKGHGSSSSSQIPQSLTNWVWESGSESANSPGSYETQGTASVTSQPSGRYGAMSWIDSTGQFWIFSGAGGVNDMWAFNTGTLQWTWERGGNGLSGAVAGTYPASPNLPASATNLPGQRNSAATWVDKTGNLWMFGGYGTDSNGLIGYMNDMWSFSPSTKWWAWIGGSASAGALAGNPNWGTLGVADPANQPNPRSNAATWTDAAGNFYMYGGNGYLNSGTYIQGDLWQYNPVANLWTWINGSQSPTAIGSYGSIGVTVAANKPGARHSATTWTSSDGGTFWLYGGTGVDANGTLGDLNDLWKYDVQSNMWTWVSGSNLVNATGVYGTNEVFAATNQPGARYGATGWIGKDGNLWLFGGNGINSTGTPVVLNDLWEYQTATNQWVWFNGSYNGNSPGYYGTLNTLSSSNIPGSRIYSSNWVDSAGVFWLYGGQGFDASSTNGRLGDLWKYTP